MTMRLLIYFLALLSGFSAAEAARPVSANAATVGASAQVSAELVAVAVCAQRQVAFAGVTISQPKADLSLTSCARAAATVASTPVSRFDSARE
jgi:hypothetical protein